MDLNARLALAREVLGGTTNRIATHPSMFDPDVISFAHGDGTRRPHPSVLTAAVEALLDTARGSLDDYLFQQHHTDLEDVLTARFCARGIPHRNAANLIIDSGTTRIFSAFLHAVAEAGDVFLVPRSYYHPLPSWCELFGVDLRLVPTTSATDFKLTADQLRQACGGVDAASRSPRGLFLFNPTQTGALYTTDELSRLAAVISEFGLMVLEDNIFAGTEFPGHKVSHLAATAPQISNSVVTVMGASKAFNLANLRIGWACGPADVIETMNSYRMTTMGNVPYVTQSMALAALNSPEKYLDDISAECSGRAQLITALIAELNHSVGTEILGVTHQPQAGHGILVSAEGLAGLLGVESSTVASIDIARYLLAEAGIAVSPGLSLGIDGPQLRFVFGSVGLKQSYAPVRQAELAALATGLIRHADGLVGHVPYLEPSTDDIHAGGRKLIEQAFLGRILPAVQRLTVGRNQRTLARHVMRSSHE